MDRDLSDILKSTHETDQMLQGVKQLAQLVAAYRQELKDQGFTALEALTLTAQFQTAIIQASGNKGKDGQP